MDISYVLIIISFAITIAAQIFINCRYNKYLNETLELKRNSALKK